MEKRHRGSKLRGSFKCSFCFFFRGRTRRRCISTLWECFSLFERKNCAVQEDRGVILGPSDLLGFIHEPES